MVLCAGPGTPENLTACAGWGILPLVRSAIPLQVLLGCTRDRVLASLAFFAGTLVAACSANETPRPAQLGDCVPAHDARCPDPLVSGGSGSGPGAGDASPGDGGAIFDADAGACGIGAILVTTSNTTCGPCLTGLCCMANQQCSANASCVGLVECLALCAAGDLACITTCYGQQPAGVSGYNDFAQCVQQNCSPECPSLPQTTLSDL